MSSFNQDYKKIYKIQDRVLNLIIPSLNDFYLTGGTALGRYYLNHRYSDDLDFFVNKDPEFSNKVQEIFRILKQEFKINETVTFLTSDFVRISLFDEVSLKIEFVNDIAFRWGNSLRTRNNLPIDNIANILANKLTALVSRDEPKDVFDIISIANAYYFNWKEIYKNAFEKQIMNEADVARRLMTFPTEWMVGQPWLMTDISIEPIKSTLEIIADDFLFARDNSLGKGKIHIMEAIPAIF